MERLDPAALVYLCFSDSVDIYEPPQVIDGLSSGCDTCGNTLICDASNGHIVCCMCGVVRESIIDETYEGQYPDSDKTGRCGNVINPLLPKSSLGTCITGVYGIPKMMHLWDAMPHNERSLNKIFILFDDVGHEWNTPKCVIDDAKELYATFDNCKHETGEHKGCKVITRQDSRRSMYAGVHYEAFKGRGITKTIDEMALMWNTTCPKINKSIKKLIKFCGDKMNTSSKNVNISEIVERLCNTMKLKSHHTTRAIKLAKNIDKLNLATDHHIYSVAVTCIWLMMELHGIGAKTATATHIHNITKKQLAETLDITPVTINKTYKKLLPYICIIDDDGITAKIADDVKLHVSKLSFNPEIIALKKQFGLYKENN